MERESLGVFTVLRGFGAQAGASAQDPERGFGGGGGSQSGSRGATLHREQLLHAGGRFAYTGSTKMSAPPPDRPIKPEMSSSVRREAAPPLTESGVRANDASSLYRCGPMGIGVSFSRPGLFVVTYQNCTEIIATRQGLLGVRKMPRFVFARHGRHAGERVFSIPWKEVIEVRRADYLLNAALWIRYRVGDTVKGVGIEAGLFWRHHIRDLESIMRRSCATDVADSGNRQQP